MLETKARYSNINQTVVLIAPSLFWIPQLRMHCEDENNRNYDPRENKAEHQSKGKQNRSKERKEHTEGSCLSEIVIMDWNPFLTSHLKAV